MYEYSIHQLMLEELSASRRCFVRWHRLFCALTASHWYSIQVQPCTYSTYEQWYMITLLFNGGGRENKIRVHSSVYFMASRMAVTITLARLCSMSGVQRLIQCDALLLRRKLVTPRAVVFSRFAQVVTR